MTVYLMICLVALLISGLGLAGALIFLHRLRLPKLHLSGRVTLILPLTGKAPGLEDLSRALGAQSIVPRRLIVSVESESDPAYRRASDLVGKCSFPVEVVVAEHANQCAQKCANQIVALRRIDGQDEAIVLFDADILPPRWWLSALVTPLLDGSADVVTGYRWQTFETGAHAARLGLHLLASVDRSIAMLPRFGWFNLTWGGSLALSPRALAALQPERILATTLSDDCTLGERAGALGLRVLNRRVVLVPTPMRGELLSNWRFARRQYQIIRIYRPSLWWLAFCATSARLAAWVVLFAHLHLWSARLVLGVLIGISLAGLAVQSLVARRLGFSDPVREQFGQALLATFKPVVDLFHWSVVAAALAARTVRWGHVVYRVRGPGDISVRSHAPWT